MSIFKNLLLSVLFSVSSFSFLQSPSTKKLSSQNDDYLAYFDERDFISENYTFLDSNIAQLPESNNYEISFEINNKYSGFGINLYGLVRDSDVTRLYFDDAGIPMIQVALGNYSMWYGLYNNMPYDAGVYNSSSLILNNDGKAKVSFIYYNNWVIYKLNGTVMMATALKPFANNNGLLFDVEPITKIALQCEGKAPVKLTNAYVREYNASSDAETLITLNGQYAKDNNNVYQVPLTESVTFSKTIFNSQLTGGWFVDDEPKEEGFELSSIEDKTYNVYYQIGKSKSNTIKVNFYEKKLSIACDADYIANGESVTISASKIGLSSEIEWSIKLDDNEYYVLTSEHSNSLELNYANYSNAKKIYVKASCENVNSNELSLNIESDLQTAFFAMENASLLEEFNITPNELYGSYTVNSDDPNDCYLCSTHLNSNMDTSFGVSKDNYNIPQTKNFAFSFKTYVPSGAHAYLYVPLLGFDANNPLSAPEARMTFLEDGTVITDLIVRDSLTNESFYYGQRFYRLGENLFKYDTWMTFTFVSVENQFAIYLDETIVSFGYIEAAPVLSLSFNMFQNGQVPVLLRIKDIKIYGIVQPKPALEEVMISISSKKSVLGNPITVVAYLTPFDAEAAEINWFANGNMLEEHTLRISFCPDTAGIYTLKCVIDGVESSTKQVEFIAPAVEEKGCSGSIESISIIPITLTLVALTLLRKKEEQ